MINFVLKIYQNAMKLSIVKRFLYFVLFCLTHLRIECKTAAYIPNSMILSGENCLPWWQIDNCLFEKKLQNLTKQ